MEKKNCLITGANRGLGLSLVNEFKSQGYNVIGLGRNREEMERLKEARRLDDYFVCDLADPEGIETFVSAFENQYDRLELLIHNAAIQKEYEILDTNAYHKIVRTEMQINFHAPVSITGQLLPTLLQSKTTIVLIGSLLHIGPKRSAPGYCASKAALASWSANLREQLSATGVRVVEVIPGLIKTNMSEKASRDGVDPDRLAAEIGRNLSSDRIILPGAKLGWRVSRFAPGFIQKKLLKAGVGDE